MKQDAVDTKEVVYPELSYKIVGTAFEVFNKLGYGFQEKYYQRAFSQNLDSANITYKKEYALDIKYNGQSLGKYLLDFVIDDKLVVGLKVRKRLGYIDIKQALNYLKVGGYKLAIIIYFTKEGVKYRRIINNGIK